MHVLISYASGSTTVYPYDDPELDPIELGASIFVKVNKNLWRASEEFGLERISFDGDSDEVLGIWDGQEFPLTVSVSLVHPMFLERLYRIRSEVVASTVAGWTN